MIMNNNNNNNNNAIHNITTDRAYTLDVTFRQAKDYPVDLYYIMDLSNTMLKSKKQVANLGNELGK